jgi:signal transduction histidine kinase
LTHYRQVLESQVAERTADLVASQQARDRIFANVNHEIRTPLSLMRIAVARLRAETDVRIDPAQLQHLDTIEYGTRKLLTLIDAILLLAARAEGKLELRAGRCDLDGLLRLIANAWRGAAEREGIVLEYVGASLPPLALDEEKLERAVANLLSNALKFTPKGGRIELKLEPFAERIDVSVKDTGVGVSEEFRARAFGRFEQDKTPLRGSPGSGIGLSLVKEIAELHRGRAILESPPTGGTLARLTLPRVDAAMSPTNGVQRHDRPELSPEAFGLSASVSHVEIVNPPTTAAATVLVAEDEPFLLSELGRIIGAHYRVLLAPDGKRALELAKAHLPDLLVSDVEMPGMNGLELLAEFEKLPNIRMPSALLVTAHGHLDQRVMGLRSGAVDYIVKPFDPAELLARVQSQILLRARALKAAKDQESHSLTVLTSGMAHELRNAANGLFQSIDLLKSMFPPELLAQNEAVSELFDVAESSSKRIRQISMELLGIHPNGELVRRDVEWKTLLTAARGIAASHFRDVELIVDTAYDGPLWCAEQLMVGVISNLLVNGAQAAGPGGWVRLTNRIEHDRFVFEVADSGRGVSPPLRDKVFQLYFTTKAPGVGSGIGLYMCRQIMEKHSGLIDVRDAADRALFHVELPLRRA